MTSENRVTTFLSDEDKKLFDRAVQLYKVLDAELAREIIHSWLFSNKLQLIKKKK